MNDLGVPTTTRSEAPATSHGVLGWARRIDVQRYGPLLALAVLFAFSSLSNPYFLRWQNLLNILRQVSYVGIIAAGMTVVIIAGGIDLSVGSLSAFLGGLSILVLNRLGGDASAVLAAAGVACATGALAGVANGMLITKGRIAPFVVTLGTMAIYRSLTLYVAQGGEFRSYSQLFGNFGSGRLGVLPYPVIAFALVVVATHVLLTRTRFGRYVFAVGSNERVALYSGIATDRVKVVTYALIGLMVGISSVLLAARLNSVSSSTAGLNYELDAIAAVIIGGTSLRGGVGSVGGSVIGVLILGIINNLLNMLNVSAYLQGTVKGLIIIAAVLLQRRRRAE